MKWCHCHPLFAQWLSAAKHGPTIRSGLAAPQTACYEIYLSLVYWSSRSRCRASLVVWTFPLMSGVIAGSRPLLPFCCSFSWTFVSVLQIFSHELYRTMRTHRPSYVCPLPGHRGHVGVVCGTWPCSQLYGPWAVAETYLWSPRVHYPSDNERCVARCVWSAVMFRCLMCVNTMPTTALLKYDLFSYRPWFVGIGHINASSVHLRTNGNTTKSKEKCIFQSSKVLLCSTLSCSNCLEEVASNSALDNMVRALSQACMENIDSLIILFSSLLTHGWYLSWLSHKH